MARIGRTGGGVFPVGETVNGDPKKEKGKMYGSK